MHTLQVLPKQQLSAPQFSSTADIMSIAVITAVAVVSNHDLIYDAISHSVSTAGMGGLNMSNSFDQQIDQVMLKGNQIPAVCCSTVCTLQKNKIVSIYYQP